MDKDYSKLIFDGRTHRPKMSRKEMESITNNLMQTINEFKNKNMIKAIIVKHPTQDFKALLFGIDFHYLELLAELRAINKKTITKRFTTKTFKDMEELRKYSVMNNITFYHIDMETYRAEVNSYFKLN